MKNIKAYLDYKRGLKKGIPIGIGYFPVSFTFGIMAASNGIPIWLAIFISLSNLTSAGQFAGTNLIISGAGNIEIALTTFVINIRYMLMSLALSQKLEKGIGIGKRLIFGYGITDEVFAIASTETKKISAEFMYGLITLPVIGWTLGTAFGACTSSILPNSLANAMEIALYAMFIAIIIPPAKKSKPIIFVIILSILITCILKYISIFKFISDGFKIIIATILSSGITAFIYPVNEEENQ